MRSLGLLWKSTTHRVVYFSQTWRLEVQHQGVHRMLIHADPGKSPETKKPTSVSGRQGQTEERGRDSRKGKVPYQPVHVRTVASFRNQHAVGHRGETLVYVRRKHQL